MEVIAGKQLRGSGRLCCLRDLIDVGASVSLALELDER
jgi:hypothetical protein